MKTSFPIALAVLASLGVLLVFLVPASCGPFSATQGPATAFRALVSAHAAIAAIGAVLLLAILRRGCHCRGMREAGDFGSAPAPVTLRC
jgi:hypothetical protein